MRAYSLVRSLVAAVVPAALGLSLLEGLGLWWQHGASVSTTALATLLGATLALSALGLLLVSPLVALLARWPLQRAFAMRRGWRRAIGALLMLGAVSMHVVNATFYVRLYATLHALLAALTLLTLWLAVALLQRREMSIEPRTSGALVPGLLAASGLVLLLTCVLAIASDPALRATTLEGSAMLGPQLRALDAVTGVLGAVSPAQPAHVAHAPLDPSVLASLEPAAITHPSGRARGAPVLLLTIDSMRYDRWRAGGAAREVMPELERWASLSTRFTRAYAPSCWTIHSMGAVLFGQLPSALPVDYVGVASDLTFLRYADGAARARDPLTFKKVTPVPNATGVTTLVEALRDGGYETMTVASYVYYFRDAGLTADFEHVDESSYRALGIGVSGLAHVPMVERALALLDARDTARPFFLWLHFMDAHAPYEARDAAAQGKGSVERYDSELRAVDRELLALRMALDQRGLWDALALIVHADHGEEFGDHGGGFHATTLYDETVRVPLLVRMPGQVAGAQVDTVVSLYDLAPTLLDVLGVRTNARFMGRSLAPALAGGALDERPHILECERFAAQKRAYVRFPFKLIVDRGTGSAQLFALTTDPTERHNLVGAEPALYRGLAAELDQAHRAIAAQLPLSVRESVREQAREPE